MIPLAIRLQQAGLDFVSASATHNARGMRIDEVTCKTQEDLDKVKQWSVDQGFKLIEARLATPEEIAQSEETPY